MKSFFVVALFVVAAAALPLTPDGEAQILRYNSDNQGVDGYNYAVETSNGINVEENGVLKNVGLENQGMEVHGQFSYIGTDGVTYTVRYIANEFGFQPQGEHLPQA